MSLKQIEANALAHFECLPVKGGYDVMREAGLTLINCGFGSSMFNIVYGGLSTMDGATMGEAIQSAINHYAGQPFAWWVPESEESSKLTEQLLAEGFVVEADEHAMLATLDFIPPNTAKSTLEVKRVEGQDKLDDFISVVEVYDPTVRPFYTNLPQGALAGAEQLYIGYAEGRAVCTAILFVKEGGAGIFSVITDERERGKGFGTDMMIYLLEESRAQGVKTVTLSASSDSGFRIYERLGFKRLGQFECFEWQGA